jgi:hypothetical protein
MGNRHRFRSSDPEVLHILRECHRIRNRLGTQCGATKLSTNRPIGKGEDIEEHPLNQKSDSYKDQPTDDLPPERRRVAIVVVGAYPVEDGPIGYSVRDRWAQGYEYPPARIPGLRDDLEDRDVIQNDYGECDQENQDPEDDISRSIGRKRGGGQK